MKKNKKAVLFFSIILSLLLAFVFIPWAMKVKISKQYQFNNQMAESPLLLLRTYEKGEKVLFFIDKSADLAFKESVDETYSNGFISGDCGTYNGYKLLNTETKNCYPEITSVLKEVFVPKLYEYFDLYKEKIPRLGYSFFLTKIDGNISLTGKAESALRIDVSELEPLNFKLQDLEIEEVIKTEPEQEPEQQEPEQQPTQQPVQTTGKCSFVADFAKQYIGCPYSLNYVYILSPQNCYAGGLTCATFVGSVITYTLGSNNYPYGHGRAKCSNGAVYQLGVNPAVLQPADIFATEYQRRDGSYTAWGHTGMYVGRGYVIPASYGGPFCYRQYTPDPNGDYIFIHSYGWQDMGQPGVCYDTYNNLFVGTQLKLTNFCRPKVCA